MSGTQLLETPELPTEFFIVADQKVEPKPDPKNVLTKAQLQQRIEKYIEEKMGELDAKIQVYMNEASRRSVAPQTIAQAPILLEEKEQKV